MTVACVVGGCRSGCMAVGCVALGRSKRGVPSREGRCAAHEPACPPANDGRTRPISAHWQVAGGVQIGWMRRARKQVCAYER